jgi:hypothetical protein
VTPVLVIQCSFLFGTAVGSRRPLGGYRSATARSVAAMTRRNSGGDAEGSKARKRKRGQEAEPDERPAKISQHDTGNDSDDSTPPESVPGDRRATTGFTSRVPTTSRPNQ